MLRGRTRNQRAPLDNAYPTRYTLTMSSPFLLQFSSALVSSLTAEHWLDVESGTDEQVVVYLANYLGRLPHGHSLVSATLAALLACEAVTEVYCTNEQLKHTMETLRYPA